MTTQPQRFDRIDLGDVLRKRLLGHKLGQVFNEERAIFLMALVGGLLNRRLQAAGQ